MHLVGLPDAALQESRDRVRAAITNCGKDWPMQRLTLALSPATLPKTGSLYDIALASAILAASRRTPWHRLEKTVLLGELALDGRVRPVNGVLPAVLAAKTQGWPSVIVPVDNLAEASLVDGIGCSGFARCATPYWLDAGTSLDGQVDLPPPAEEQTADLADVLGRKPGPLRRRGGRRGRHLHHAHRTARSRENNAGATTSGSAARSHRERGTGGYRHPPRWAITLSPQTPLITRPPFIAPHHSSSVAALVGGGSGMARPRAVSRAHRGVLFLDECAEMGTSALEALRTPLEDGEIRIARRDRGGPLPGALPVGARRQPVPVRADRPAGLRLFATATAPLHGQAVRSVTRPGRPQGADAHGSLGAFAPEASESSAQVRARVANARAAAADRWRPYDFTTNAEVSGSVLRRYFRLDTATMAPLRKALGRGIISIRGLDRSLRMAWTLADLGGRTVPGVDDVAIALSFRQTGITP